tara:strand:- start:419 stop:1567 length:1149 start_codon:yes stop_codon:yes gene_type:complete
MLHPIIELWPYHEYKSFIIHNKESILSRWSSNNTLRSAKRCGIYASVYDGVNKLDHLRLMKKYELKWNPQAKVWWNSTHHLDATAACFLSHYLLWNRCVEMNKPIFIIEHDVEFNQHISIPKELFDFDGVINLGQPTSGYWWNRLEETFTHRDLSECTLPHSPHRHGSHQDVDYCNCEKNTLIGAHSYIITPNAAKKLINKAKIKGIDKPDVFIDVDTVDIVDVFTESGGYISTQKQNFSLIEKGWDNVWEDSKWGLPENKQDAVYCGDTIVLPCSPKWKEWLNVKPADDLIEKVYDVQSNILLKGANLKDTLDKSKDMLHGEKDGMFRDYYDDNSLRCEGLYKDGEMQGEWIYYLQDGSVDAKYEMKDGKLIDMDRHSWRR